MPLYFHHSNGVDDSLTSLSARLGSFHSTFSRSRNAIPPPYLRTVIRVLSRVTKNVSSRPIAARESISHIEARCDTRDKNTLYGHHLPRGSGPVYSGARRRSMIPYAKFPNLGMPRELRDNPTRRKGAYQRRKAPGSTIRKRKEEFGTAVTAHHRHQSVILPAPL